MMTESNGTEVAPDGQRLPASRKVRLMAILFGTIFALALGEIGLRFTQIGTGGYIGMPDDWTGGSYRPGSQAVFGREGFSVVRINSFGMRDHETTLEKPPGVFRIGMFGDSYLEAAQVALDRSVSKLLAQGLRGQGSYEVLNFGVSGYGTAQEYLRLRELGLKFDLDLVILCITSGNDIRNNSEALNGTSLIPYFTLDEQGELVPDMSFRDEPAFKAAVKRSESLVRRAVGWIWGRSRLAGLFISALRGREDAVPIPRDPDAAACEPFDPAFNGDWMIYDPNPPRAWQDAWRVTEQLILTTADLCRSRNIGFAVVLITNTPQVSDDERKLLTDKYPELDIDYPHRRLSEYCSAQGIPCLDLVPPLHAYFQRTGHHPHGFGNRIGQGHWNEEGHAVAAEQIASFLDETGLLRR